jgi:hypothetical protein
VRIDLVQVDSLMAYEWDALALGMRFSLHQLLTNKLSDDDLDLIRADMKSIEYWFDQFKPYKGRETDLLAFKESLIHVWEPPIDGHYIADGFHRLAAAKLVGLGWIGAKLSSTFRERPKW